MTVQRPITLPNGQPGCRVVDEISADAVETDFLPNIRNRWKILMTPLPLLGGAALASKSFPSSLADAMPWHAQLIAFVGRETALMRGCGHAAITLPPTILVGPPGIGKSHAARSLASHAGLGFASFDAGGASDNRAMAGTARGFTAATPAWPVTTIALLKTANPLLLVDELEKAGGSAANGYLHDTLLSLTEPSTAAAWYDPCLMSPADLSSISWLFSSNDLSSIPRTLRSRVEIIELTRPSPKWACQIVERIAIELVVGLGLPPPAAEHLLGAGNVKNRAVSLHKGGADMRDVRRLLRAGLADHINAIRRRLDH